MENPWKNKKTLKILILKPDLKDEVRFGGDGFQHFQVFVAGKNRLFSIVSFLFIRVERAVKFVPRSSRALWILLYSSLNSYKQKSYK